ncbi:MAG: amidase [Rhodothermales bacterium]|nr:amidase [Rhodothermales bacterium]MDZ4700941.1 amidase [Rhodothermales bacterium]
MTTDLSLPDLAGALRAGRLSSRQLVASALERILDPAGEGSRAFVQVNDVAAFAAAEDADARIAAGRDGLPLLGLPISIKDLFDVAGETTRAGSVLLADQPPADRDAPAINRLRAAGAIFIGRTNMTEFAFSGLGINPHYGTPAAPYDRANVRRIPGGSTSGGAVSVADGMAAAAIGTDTGGSTRIPPAFCGLVGFKPTARRISTEGVFPLAPSLDSVGPIGRTVACCVVLDQVMSGAPVRSLDPLPLRGRRFLLPTNEVLDDLDAPVASAFLRTLARMRDAGAEIVERRFEALDMLAEGRTYGPLAPVEAYAVHRRWYHARQADYDPRVHMRMAAGVGFKAAEYMDILAWRRRFIERAERELAGYDAYIMPTVPMIPPPIADIIEGDDAHYLAVNTRALRNTSIVNALDGCALTIPCHRAGEAPAGFTVAGSALQDERVLQLGLSVEAVLAA